MLPTTGFFKNIECPYQTDACDRPYCHFLHVRKPPAEPEQLASEAPAACYKPTPKSELAVRTAHIPISYVPDLAVSVDRPSRYNTQTYKPTPISVLCRPNEVYKPAEDADLNLEDLTGEFDMIDKLMSESEADVRASNGDDKREKRSTTTTTTRKGSESKRSNSKSSKKRSKSKSESKRSRHGRGEKKRKKDKRDDDSESKSARSKSRSKTDSHKSESAKSKRRTSSVSKRKPTESTNSHKSDSNVKLVSSKTDESSSKPPVDSDDDSSESDDTTARECYKIFAEYKPTEPEIVYPTEVTEAAVPSVSGRKRIAHEQATESKLRFERPKVPVSAARVMMNRFKVAGERVREEQMDEQSLIMEEVGRMKRRSVDERQRVEQAIRVEPKRPRTVDPPPPTTGLVDDIINGRSTTATKRRIAPVLNADLIQRAKAQIDLMTRCQRGRRPGSDPSSTRPVAAAKTAVQTAVKGGKRVAHVPETGCDVPDVRELERSKLPVTVRTRFLRMILDETVGLYQDRLEAQTRAVSEEFKCYERCAVLATYRNSAMLAVGRLRKARAERDARGLGGLLEGEEDEEGEKAEDEEARESAFYEAVRRFVLSEEELRANGFPRGETDGGSGGGGGQTSKALGGERVCVRCGRMYQVDDVGYPLRDEPCVYHPLKKRTFRGDSYYLCCKSDGGGCATSATHVSEAPDVAGAGGAAGYQTTLPPSGPRDPRSRAVYALDCEMCYTTRGLELTRVTIVNADCKTVYETLVKPLHPIVDYNTRFSGITAEQMERTATSILQVQANVLHLCNRETVLIGHSLESDMKALKIVHGSVVDTSVMFPHKFGPPHKRALRDLAREHLKKIIQNEVSGHDSAEDALACMELVKWKVREDRKVRGGFVTCK